MLRPHDVLAEIRRRRGAAEDSDEPIRFYWVTLTPEDDGGDRDRFRRLLRETAGDYPLLPVVLRVAGFEDPNAVMNDLAAVLESSRNELRSPDVRDRIVAHGFADFALVARKELALAATSSPLVLPDWFPIRSGEEVTARIEDLTWTAAVPLSAQVAHMGEIKRLLCELDRVLVRRLEAVGREDPRHVQSLLERIRRAAAKPTSYDDFLSDAKEALDAVRNPMDYRPSSRSPTVVGQLWNVTSRTTPDRLPKLAKSLARALNLAALDMEDHEQSMAAVLGRPTSPVRDAGDRWALDVVGTVRAACQLVTAAAHADAYPRYPVRLLGSVSMDLRRSLDGFVELLERGMGDVSWSGRGRFIRGDT